MYTVLLLPGDLSGGGNYHKEGKVAVAHGEEILVAPAESVYAVTDNIGWGCKLFHSIAPAEKAVYARKTLTVRSCF